MSFLAQNPREGMLFTEGLRKTKGANDPLSASESEGEILWKVRRYLSRVLLFDRLADGQRQSELL